MVDISKVSQNVMKTIDDIASMDGKKGISSKEEKDENLIETEFGLIPESLVAYDVSDFLFVDTFQDIIDNLLDNNPQFSIDDIDLIIKAINYYLENDDFMD